MPTLAGRSKSWRNWSADYLEAIESGEINAPRRVKAQYEALRPVFEGKDPVWAYDIEKGNKPIDFAEVFCRQSKDVWLGEPIKFLLWQKAAINAVYGIVDRKTGKRRFQRVFIEVGKKNGKTTMIAPIALYEATLPSHTVLSAANSLDQASIVYNEAVHMLEQSPALQKILRAKKAPLGITNTKPGNFSMFKPVSNSPDILDGKLLTTVILDEVHELYQDLYDILYNAQISVAEPLFFMLTTKGYVREGLFDSEYLNSCQILDGVVKDERKFSLLYELDKPDRWETDRKDWVQANPSLGAILTEEKLQDTVDQALSKPAALNAVKVKHFNLGGVSGDAYFALDDILNTETFELSEFKDSDCIGGFDLSHTNDLTAFSTVFMRGGKYYVDTMYWVSEDFYTKACEDSRMSSTWQVWRERGLLRVAGTHTIDYSGIVAYVMSLIDTYGIYYRYVYYDPWSAAYLVNSFIEAGFSEEYCLRQARQGAQTLGVPFQRLEAALKAKEVNYNNNPITKWCLTNVDVKEDRNGNMLPCKAGSNNKRKIDGFATMLDCFVGVVEHGVEFGVA